MYFKVKNTTKLFGQLKVIQTRIIKANAAASALAKELGNEDYYRKGYPYIGGGISAFESKTRPSGWASMAAKFGQPNLYMPKKHSKGKALWDKIEALPLVKNEEVYEIIGYPNGLMVTPGIRFGNEVFLIQIDDTIAYTPVKGMTEILSSEFKKLSDLIDVEYVEDYKEESTETN
jgi:hypothetical protein